MPSKMLPNTIFTIIDKLKKTVKVNHFFVRINSSIFLLLVL
ncbi:hypothetical protein LEP1GSC059_1278 [Leptospira noguchii serovar Panama str. CZ214]|uniref:Uncharacterized protein n=1 Tax=Leptospira noguchii serovar Panama str. CZ214 TaxID=1001595 RepID=T0FNV0_9LEPT|nr:hypothetical protein LEP1GSC059_1278 [Leptospira noguchii serovar Panama str. CZ214]